MKTVYLERMGPFLEAISQRMELYVPQATDGHYTFEQFSSADVSDLLLNPIRTYMSPKEFVFPLREIAAVFPTPIAPDDIEPFAVLGLKHCDLRALDILDKVFTEEAYEDPLYIARREQMFMISTDCTAPADSCFCNVMRGQPYAQCGFDLNLSPVEGGFVVEVGSEKGQGLVDNIPQLFSDVPQSAIVQRETNRSAAQAVLTEQNQHLHLDGSLSDMMEAGQDNEVFNEQAETCVECQACTRVCPTCHCFYLYDRKQEDYFNKLKMWDSCMRFSYARVAGGANPRTTLGDRLRHRLMHKFSYFAQRYGVDMCVGCGRCVDAEAGAVDIRVVLKRISDAYGNHKAAST
ncbi:4Fe-4S dicluster domain-containing protein [Planctomycetota bacterium]